MGCGNSTAGDGVEDLPEGFTERCSEHATDDSPNLRGTAAAASTASPAAPTSAVAAPEPLQAAAPAPAAEVVHEKAAAANVEPPLAAAAAPTSCTVQEPTAAVASSPGAVAPFAPTAPLPSSNAPGAHVAPAGQEVSRSEAPAADDIKAPLLPLTGEAAAHALGFETPGVASPASAGVDHGGLESDFVDLHDELDLFTDKAIGADLDDIMETMQSMLLNNADKPVGSRDGFLEKKLASKMSAASINTDDDEHIMQAILDREQALTVERALIT
eukprot:TRINITY_DN20259_c0_g3_i1.p1 TRINITY_DN20259_c0_g3~~TRINITY_DN20259_c0_g3_i1.p1  ORF type:complete len:272 (-),score=71.32 TRINITY_DN20259_c0_g3_i1:25-840(-)